MKADDKTPRVDAEPVSSPMNALKVELINPVPVPPYVEAHDGKDVWNYSKTLKLARHILAHRRVLPPLVRI